MRKIGLQSPPRFRPRYPKFPAGILVAVLVISAAVVYGFWGKERTDGPYARGTTALNHDLSAVWGWMDSSLAGGSQQGKWSIRFDGHWTREQTGAVAESLGMIIPFSEHADDVTASQTIGGESIQAEGRYKLTLWFQGDKKHQGEKDSSIEHANRADPVEGVEAMPSSKQQTGMVVLMIQSLEQMSYDELLAAANTVEVAAAEAGLHYNSSFTVRGQPDKPGEAELLASRAGARRLENYHDGHTSSVTYATAKLKASVESGTKRVSMQIADVSGDAGAPAEIILGVPLITGDYRTED